MMIGDKPYFKSTGLNDNDYTYVRLTKINRSSSKNLGNYPNVGTTNSPNNNIDYLSFNPRTWNIEGMLPLLSGTIYSDGVGTFLGNNSNWQELTFSGLCVLENTGSPVYFFDEVMTTRNEIVDGVSTIRENAVKVVVAKVDVGRDNTYVNAQHEVGYMVPYRIMLIEDV